MLSLVETCEFLQISTTQLTDIYKTHWGNGVIVPNRFTPGAIKQLTTKLGHSYTKRILTIAALKGGIGKTFLSLQVAVRASMKGAKVLIIDLDPEACATNSLLTEEQVSGTGKITIFDLLADRYLPQAAIIPTKYVGLDIIPASLKVSKADKFLSSTQSLWSLKKIVDSLNYDYIFFELPPSFSNLSTAAYLATDLMVVPCTPSIYSLESVELTIKALLELREQFSLPPIPYKIVLNMFNANRSASQDTLILLQDEYGDNLLPWLIRESAEIQNATNAGLTLFECKCNKELKQNLDALTNFLCPLHLNSAISNSQSDSDFLLKSSNLFSTGEKNRGIEISTSQT